jgi:hypothetical protein
MLLTRAALGFLIAYAVAEPQAVARYFETPQIALLKADLTRAEQDDAARYSPAHADTLDIAIHDTAALVRASARTH